MPHKYIYGQKIALVKDNTVRLPRTVITSSKDSADAFLHLYDEEIETRESFWVLALNRRNAPIAAFCAGVGGVAACHVDIKIILQFLCTSGASSCIISHNHPSGNTAPSQSDLDITRRIKDAARLLDIGLLDHIIVVPKCNEAEYKPRYLSFADEGYM